MAEHALSTADLLGEPTAFHAMAPTLSPLFWELPRSYRGRIARRGAGDFLQAMAIVRVEDADRARV